MIKKILKTKTGIVFQEGAGDTILGSSIDDEVDEIDASDVTMPDWKDIKLSKRLTNKLLKRAKRLIIKKSES